MSSPRRLATAALGATAWSMTLRHTLGVVALGVGCLMGGTAAADTIFSYTGAIQTFIALSTGIHHVTATSAVGGFLGGAGGGGLGGGAGGFGGGGAFKAVVVAATPVATVATGPEPAAVKAAAPGHRFAMVLTSPTSS